MLGLHCIVWSCTVKCELFYAYVPLTHGHLALERFLGTWLAWVICPGAILLYMLGRHHLITRPGAVSSSLLWCLVFVTSPSSLATSVGGTSPLRVKWPLHHPMVHQFGHSLINRSLIEIWRKTYIFTDYLTETSTYIRGDNVVPNLIFSCCSIQTMSYEGFELYKFLKQEELCVIFF